MFTALSVYLQHTEVCVVKMLIKFAVTHRQSGATEDYRFVMALGKVSISKICHIKFRLFVLSFSRVLPKTPQRCSFL